jgi:hypothetical protein
MCINRGVLFFLKPVSVLGRQFLTAQSGLFFMPFEFMRALVLAQNVHPKLVEVSL